VFHLLGALVFAPQPQARRIAPRRSLPDAGFLFALERPKLPPGSAGWPSADAKLPDRDDSQAEARRSSRSDASLAGALRLRSSNGLQATQCVVGS
jgi:hypothetical protein